MQNEPCYGLTPFSSSYHYDLNGNLLTDGNRNFAYDDENELISVWQTNVWRNDFVYDGKLRRRIERDYTWNGSAWTETGEIHFIYDGNLVVQERDANNTPQVTYTRGNDLSGTLQGAGGIGGLLARTDRAQVASWIVTPGGGLPGYGTHSYFHADGNGNITALISASQMIVAKNLYDPYGNTLSMYGSLADVNHYRFSSKEWNANSGLYYYFRRFYDPNLQRWLNRDPIQERGGLNLYAYVRNNPINLFDPLGLTDCAALAAAIANQENLIHGAIQSMSDINQMYDNAQNMQITALGGEFAYAFMGGGSAAAELSEYNAVRFSRPVYNLGGVTSAIAFNEAVYAGLVDVPNSAIADTTGLNILNPAEMVAEKENEMGNNMSESTYQTIQGLQAQLANMMDN
jgi:RHS repeat-associated protein